MRASSSDPERAGLLGGEEQCPIAYRPHGPPLRWSARRVIHPPKRPGGLGRGDRAQEFRAEEGGGEQRFLVEGCVLVRRPPPALAGRAPCQVFLDEAEFGQLPQMITRGTARLPDPFGQHARRGRSPLAQLPEEPDAQGMRQALQVPRVEPRRELFPRSFGGLLVCHDANIYLQRLFCNREPCFFRLCLDGQEWGKRHPCRRMPRLRLGLLKGMDAGARHAARSPGCGRDRLSIRPSVHR